MLNFAINCLVNMIDGNSANDILDLETAAAGTTLSADPTLRSAFETLINGDRWMIFRNTVTDVLHFDFVRIYHSNHFPCVY